MCYSAQIEAEFATYKRMTGAEMDIHQFAEIFGFRVKDPRIRVPRAVDRWFDHPKGAGELELRNLVMQHRAKRMEEYEAEIAKQRQRIADAEAKMATKPTKKATEDLRIAPKLILDTERKMEFLRNWDKPTSRDDRIFPMEYVPIVLMAEGKPVLRLARYHCRQNGKPATIDRERDGLYNARRDNIDRFWRKEFGTTHALMLVKTFWENVPKADGNHVLHYTPDPGDLMCIACVYSVWQNPAGGASLLSFAAVTDNPPPEIKASGHDRCMINLKPENVHAWLTPEGRSDAELQALLEDKQRPYYQHEDTTAAAA